MTATATATAANRDHLRTYLSGVLTSLASARVIPAGASLSEIVGTLAGKFASDVWADSKWVLAETARVFGSTGLRMGAARLGQSLEDKAVATGDARVAGAAKIASQAFVGLVDLAVAELTKPTPKR